MYYMWKNVWKLRIFYVSHTNEWNHNCYLCDNTIENSFQSAYFINIIFMHYMGQNIWKLKKFYEAYTIMLAMVIVIYVIIQLKM